MSLVAKSIGSILLALSLFTHKVQASESTHPLPSNPCDYAACSTQQESIWAGFTQAGALDLNEDAKVFSGACYHLSPSYAPDYTHHGVALIEKKEDGLHFNGQFSFYFPQNPYETWTLEEAREKLNPKYTPNNLVNMESDYAWVDFNPGKTPPWQYYLRQSGPSIWLIAFWGTQQTVFCELNEH